jgi:hypothetical protein
MPNRQLRGHGIIGMDMFAQVSGQAQDALTKRVYDRIDNALPQSDRQFDHASKRQCIVLA